MVRNGKQQLGLSRHKIPRASFTFKHDKDTVSSKRDIMLLHGQYFISFISGQAGDTHLHMYTWYGVYTWRRCTRPGNLAIDSKKLQIYWPGRPQF